MEQLVRQIQNLCFTKDLAPVQWSALRYLAKAGPVARTVSGLAAYSGVNQSSASRTIQLLQKKGLVHIGTDPQDNRIRRVSLSESGRELLTRDPLATLAAAVETLDPEQKEILRDSLESVLFQLCPKPFQSDG